MWRLSSSAGQHQHDAADPRHEGAQHQHQHVEVVGARLDRAKTSPFDELGEVAGLRLGCVSNLALRIPGGDLGLAGFAVALSGTASLVLSALRPVRGLQDAPGAPAALRTRNRTPAANGSPLRKRCRMVARTHPENGLAIIFEREGQEIARRFAADGSAAARMLIIMIASLEHLG
jgi:hypothetical protein